MSEQLHEYILTYYIFRGIKTLSLKGGIVLSNHPRYRAQDDPADPSIPLAWVYQRNGKVVGSPPLHQYGQYRQLEIAGTNERWLIHCSYAGVLSFLSQTLGENNLNIPASGTGRVLVKQGMKGSWVGNNGCVASFLKTMLGLDFIEIAEDPNWKRDTE